jgi:hypothetical protein
MLDVDVLQKKMNQRMERRLLRRTARRGVESTVNLRMCEFAGDFPSPNGFHVSDRIIREF